MAITQRDDLSSRMVLFVLVITLVVSIVSFGVYMSSLSAAAPNQFKETAQLSFEIRNPVEPSVSQQARDKAVVQLSIVEPPATK